MIPILKAEFKKLLTIRSTYVSCGIAFLIIIFMSFYIEGYRGIAGTSTSEAGPAALQELMLHIAGLVSQVASIVAILFMVHEYRYNMIMYTLTASNSRSKVLASKILAIVSFTIIFTLLSAAIAIGSYYAGLALRGDVSLAPQSWDMITVMARLLFYCLGGALAGLLFATLLRNIAISIALLFMLPVTVEPLIGLILKDNAAYLPFAALEKVIFIGGAGDSPFVRGNLSPGKGAAVFAAYLLVGWLITWVLFVRRDAN